MVFLSCHSTLTSVSSDCCETVLRVLMLQHTRKFDTFVRSLFEGQQVYSTCLFSWPLVLSEHATRGHFGSYHADVFGN